MHGHQQEENRQLVILLFMSRETEEKVAAFQALKQLKATENDCDTLKKRIKVMELNEQSTKKRMELQQIQFDRLMQIRQRTEDENKKMNRLRQQLDKSLEQTRIKNLESKQQRKERIHETMEKMTLDKCQNHEKICKETELNETIKNRIQQEDTEQKKRNKEKISSQEATSQENIIKFLKNKSDSVHQDQENERDYLLRKRDKKKKEIQTLGKTEMEIVERYSQSQMAFKEMKNKLDGMLCRVRQGKKEQRDRSLAPSLHESQKTTQP